MIRLAGAGTPAEPDRRPYLPGAACDRDRRLGLPGGGPNQPLGSRRHLRLVTDEPACLPSPPAIASVQTSAAARFSALHFRPCVECGLELRRIVHGFATERVAGLFIVEQGWLDFSVYETRRLPEVLRE